MNGTNAAAASSDSTPLIDFASLIGSFGADFGEMQDGSLRMRIELYDLDGLFATLTPPIADGTRFYGFVGDAGEGISQIRFVPIEGTNDIFGFDNIELASPAAVPEPASLLLLGAGLAGFAVWRQRRT